jgi:NADPH:quinone reductase-like Zn-dependent oxidoreductase
MQAVQIARHGGPEVLEIVELPRPTAGPGEVVARVLGVSVNHLDLWVRRGMPGVQLPLPLIPGCDGTGEIVELGSGVEGLAVGQKVVLEPGYNDADSSWVRKGLEHLADDYKIRGEHGDGFAREFVALPARYVQPIPAGIDAVQAAAAPLVFLTAWGMLHTRAALERGETVLVIAGTSGVGSAAIQLARAAGARVFSTAGSEAKRSLARELGAEEVFDHGDSDWPKGVRAATDGRGVDVVVEHVGPATWTGSTRVLARNGRLVTCGGTTGSKVEILLPHLFMKNLSVLGSTMGPRSALGPIFEGLAAGRWKTVVDRVLPLSEISRAHEWLESRAVSGKIVLVPGS